LAARQQQGEGEGKQIDLGWKTIPIWENHDDDDRW
jgi:hypothetical protein